MQKNASLLLIIGSILLVNALAVGLFARVDITQDRRYTLSEATIETLASLEDPVTVNAYFTRELPPPFSDVSRYSKDLLEEYRVKSGGKVNFAFRDPNDEETQADKAKKQEVKQDIFGRATREATSIEKELQEVGIEPVEIRVLEQDKAQTKRAYMAMSVRYGDKRESLPVIQNTASLEYDLTMLIRRLTNKKVPVLGVLQGHGEPGVEDKLARLRDLFARTYEMREVTLKADEAGAIAVPDDVDAMLVIGPAQRIPDEEQKALDAFLMQGKSIGFFLDQQRIELQEFSPSQTSHGLEDLVEAYGVGIGNQIVGDVACAALSVTEKRGFMTVQMPIKYPFIPMIPVLSADSPVTKGLTDISVPFAFPLFPVPVEKRVGFDVKVLARSSDKSWLETPTQENLNPRRDWGSTEINFTGPYDLMVTSSGALPSKFNVGQKSVTDARVFVAGTASLFDEQVLTQANVGLLMNAMDWLVLDQKMLSLRTKAGFADAPFDPNLLSEIGEPTRKLVKIFNLVGLPILLGLYGLARWRMRAVKRQRVATTA